MDCQLIPGFVIVFYLAVFGAIFGFAILRMISRNRSLKKLGEVFQGYVPGLALFPNFKGEFQGMNFYVSLFERSKSSPSYLNIALLKGPSFKLSIYKQSFLGDLGKKIGILREIEINDPEFDRQFMIFSNDAQRAAAYLRQEEVKNTIRCLMKEGFTALKISPKQTMIRKPNYQLEKDIEGQRIKDILLLLSLLVRKFV